MLGVNTLPADTSQHQPVGDVFKIWNRNDFVVAGHAGNRLAAAAEDVVMGRVGEVEAVGFSHGFAKNNAAALERFEVAVDGDQVEALLELGVDCFGRNRVIVRREALEHRQPARRGFEAFLAEDHFHAHSVAPV